jgi:uncharacterized protein (DUF433 family)/DNA-binding transcriptional MerR regulator
MADVREIPPRGRYLAHEVGRLAGVSGDRIGQWARRGYIRSSVSSGRPRVYSYQDVAEAMVVHELVQREVALDAIKDAIDYLRESTGTAWPLSHARLSVPRPHTAAKRKKRTVVVSEDEAVLPYMYVQRLPNAGMPNSVLIDTGSGALVLGVDLVAIASDLARGGWAAREMPDLEHIEVHPDRLSGRPAIRGRRVSAEDVAEMATTSEGVHVLRQDYGLTAEEIEDAQRWWEAVRRFESAA